MYIKDGEENGYMKNNYGAMAERDHTYAWGWLGKKVESQGWRDQELKTSIAKKLSSFGKYYKSTVNHTRGFHICEICGEGMGSSEIHISYNGKIYQCPSNVDHYIEAHDYRPNDLVIEAIQNGVVLMEEDYNMYWAVKESRTDEEIMAERNRVIKAAVLKGCIKQS